MRMQHSSTPLPLALAAVLGAGIGCGDSSPPTGQTTTGSTSTGDTGPSDTDRGSTGTSAATSTSMGSGSSDGSADTTAGETGEPPVLSGPCALEDKVGGFTLLREADYTTFSGAVADGVVPSSVLENVGEGSGCVLLRRNNPFCNPACSPGTTCDFDGACVPYPANHDVGVVSVTGLVQAVMVDPLMPTYEYFDTSLAHPAWETGAAIALMATGGDYEAFALYGSGVTMIEPSGEEVVLDPSMPLDITWVPDAEGPGTVRVEINIDQHGLTPVELFCEVEDTGSLTIPVELIADFVQFGVTGFPSVTYFRETLDSVEIEPGCVELGVRSHAQGTLSVVGHTPCNAPSDCPPGQDCNIMIQTCE